MKLKSPSKQNIFRRFPFWTSGLLLFILVVLASLLVNDSSSDNKHDGKKLKLRHAEFLKKYSTKDESKCEWKPEPLMGPCDVTIATEVSQKYKAALDCQRACCESDSCVTFQFRAKEGCLHGGDTRLGAEKDGPGEWCEPRAPAMWKGQRLTRDKIKVPGACDDANWDPTELGGQCFGFGEKRQTKENTPEACRDMCCSENKKDSDITELGCSSWQWREDAGCFYVQKEAGNCKPSEPEDFEMFFGKRKVVVGRTYSPHAYSADFADMENIYITN